MNRRRRILAGSLVGWLALVVAADAASKRGRAEGEIVDQEGQPLGGVQVQLIQKKSIVSEAASDENGRFRIEARTGRYVLHFDKAGFDSYNEHDYESKTIYLTKTPRQVCVRLVPLRKHEIDLQYCQGRHKEKFRDGKGRIILDQINDAISAVEQAGRDLGLGPAHSDRCDGQPADLLSCLTDLYEARATELARRGDLEGADQGFDQALALLEALPERAIATLRRRAGLYTEIKAEERELRDWKAVTARYESFLESTYPGLSFPGETSAARRINEAGSAYLKLCSLLGRKRDFATAPNACRRADFLYSQAVGIFKQLQDSLAERTYASEDERAYYSNEYTTLGTEAINRKGASLLLLAAVYAEMRQLEAAERTADQAVRHCEQFLPMYYSKALSQSCGTAYLYRGIAGRVLGKGDFCSDLEKACRGGESKGCSAHKKFCGEE